MRCRVTPTERATLRRALAAEHARNNASGAGVLRFDADGTPHPSNDDPTKARLILAVHAIPSGRYLFKPLTPGPVLVDSKGQRLRARLVDAPPSPVPERSAPTAVTQEAPRWQPPEDPDAAFLAKYGV